MAPQGGLSEIDQTDFSGGAFLGFVPENIPTNGALDLENLLVADDGTLYQRGGASMWIPPFTTGGHVHSLWAGSFDTGDVVVAHDGANLWHLDGITNVNVGAATVTAQANGALVNGFLFLDGGTIYAGSSQAAPYSTGTVTTVQGDNTVLASGTSFLANVKPGSLIRFAGADRYYIIESVDSDTQLTLRDAFEGSSLLGVAYATTAFGSMQAGAPYRFTALRFASVGRRLVSIEDDTIFASNWGDPHTWNGTNSWTFPGRIIAACAIQNSLLVFTADGVYSLSNLELELTDSAGNVQWSMSLVNRDIVAFGHGLVSWEGAVVVPSSSGVWLLDEHSAPVLVSRSIEPWWRNFANQVSQQGNAVVFQGTYLLPVLIDGEWSMLACRLDKPVTGGVFPWARVTGYDAQCSTTAMHPDGSPLGGSMDADAIVDLWFLPRGESAEGADGETFDWTLRTRGFATGGGNRNQVRKVRIRYVMTTSGSFDGASLEYQGDGDEAPTASDSVLEAPPDGVEAEAPLRLSKRARFIRFALSAGSQTAFRILGFRTFVRPSGRQS